jgi:hypothetical protein
MKMNIYKYAINELQQFSRSLTKTSLLINKPWTIVDEDSEVQKLIFKKDKSLIISKNGEVVIGKWDYLPEAKCILIDRGRDKILCKEGFVDEGLLILLKDGTDNQFFTLVNENIVHSLDPFEYIQNLRTQHLHIKFAKLPNGKNLGVYLDYSNSLVNLGCKVEVDMVNASDGLYKPLNSNKEYEVENSRIAKIFHITTYKSKSGETIILKQRDQYSISKGDYVFINEEPAPSGKYKMENSPNFRVENGIIAKRAWF